MRLNEENIEWNPNSGREERMRSWVEGWRRRNVKDLGGERF